MMCQGDGKNKTNEVKSLQQYTGVYLLRARASMAANGATPVQAAELC